MVRYAWTNNSLPTDRCPSRQIDDLSRRLISSDTGQINPQFRDAMRPYQLLDVGVTRLGACAPEVDASTSTPAEVAAVSASTTTASGKPEERRVVKGGLLGDNRFLLLMIIAATVIGVLLIILVVIIVVCCCRRQRRLRSANGDHKKIYEVKVAYWYK